jgi:hypothetical protein
MADTLIDALMGKWPLNMGLPPSWLNQAQQQTQRDIAAYQQGGVPQLLADTSAGQGLAGGFGGVTKSVMVPRIRSAAPPFEVLVNPSRSEVRSLISSYPGKDAVRHVTDSSGNHYVWDARYGTHYDFYEGMSKLGEGQMFYGPQDTTYSFKDVPVK